MQESFGRDRKIDLKPPENYRSKPGLEQTETHKPNISNL